MTEQKQTEANEMLEQETAAAEQPETGQEAAEQSEMKQEAAEQPEAEPEAAAEQTNEANPAETETADREAEADEAEAADETESAEETDSEEPDGQEPSETEEDAEQSAKGFFKKKEKKNPKDEKIRELTDRLQRQLAEFDNFRKRTEKEKSSMYQIGAKDVIEKLLPVVDNFERGLETGNAEDPFVDGMNKIYKQLTTILADLGVTPIEAVGQPFDPELHNAVMHVDDENEGENVVVEEFQKGYKYKDSVVRFSMVKVAN